MIWFDVGYPISSAFTLMTIGVILYSSIRNTQCSAALLLSLLASKIPGPTSTPEEIALHGFVMFACGLICVIDFRGKRLLIDAGKHGPNYAVAVLYAARIFVVVLALVGVISINTALIVSSEMLLLLQLLLVAWSARNGYTNRRNWNSTFNSSRFLSIIFGGKGRV